MSRRRTASAVLALVTSLALLTGCGPGPWGAESAPATDGSGRDVGVELFQWTWNSIARECTEQLGPAGYAWVLTSPPQEHIRGPQWWTSYQPVSYRLESRLGTASEFEAMVATCHEAGVEVWADAVINHMTGQDASGVGWAGSPYEHYRYPGLYGDEDFHHCALTPNDDIQDYRDPAQVQNCELVNLADLDTGSPAVHATIVAYLTSLLDLGVDGFRIDAAKHIRAADLAAIIAALPEDTGVVQEVIRGSREPIQPEDYVDNGLVFEFGWGRDVVGALQGAMGVALDLASSEGGLLPSDRAVIFVDNHDTERGDSTLSYRDGGLYELANVLMLASAYGSPVVYSGYAFDDRDAGPAQDADGRVLDASCASAPSSEEPLAGGDWVCPHRWADIAAMVAWRGVVGSAEQVDRWHDGEALAFGRGARGFIALNLSDEPLEVSLATSLPDGDYCDVLAAAPGDSNGCDEPTEVRGGRIAVSVAPRSASAWDVGHLR
jgi:alpha-amylase